MIPVPGTDADAQWSNLAPGAQVSVSSSRDAKYNRGLIDRQVTKGEIWRYWTSDPSQTASGQWVQLTFPAPVTMRTVRLYNPRPGDEANSSLLAGGATVRLYSDAGSQQIASQSAGPLSLIGTGVSFSDMKARVVRSS
jgi:hypothetical protein